MIDLDLEDVPLLGGVISSGGAVLDLLLNSGEIIVATLSIVLADPATLLRALSVLDVLGFGLIPAGLLDQLIAVLVVALFINFLGSFAIKKWENR
jgi:hypothetical protein